MNEPNAMTFLGHVGELRKRILLVVAVVVIAMIAGLFIAPQILHYLKSMPPASDMVWNVFSPWDSAKIYMSVALAFSIVVSLPYILYQIWAFVKKGLRPVEQDAAFLYIPFAFISFIIGLSFSYFIVFPMSLAFTTSITKNLGFSETYGVYQYFSFMFNIILPVSLAFELPIIVMFLTKLGVLNPKRLNALRRHAYLILVITASLISPPEIISHLMVFVPLVLLYEISIVLSGVVYRRKHQKVFASG
ncbi:twin-arginine translocase subunit TatC [Paenibacillus periandrae]|uniref:twin-arginine translocase subunit TatC n=1 Tax=Paenibacillus periandrae TaxID=1761741 RepID=UPI001F093D69|nr:twin-arginine translocase subunit TatC [Paenibacillus periandrae]